MGDVSPFTSDCLVIQRSIVYTFAEVFGTNYRVIFEVVAQEVAHSFGLDHQFLCADPRERRLVALDVTRPPFVPTRGNPLVTAQRRAS